MMASAVLGLHWIDLMGQNRVSSTGVAKFPDAKKSDQVPENTTVSPDEQISKMDAQMQSFLAEHPTLRDALATFGVAEEEYRRSLMALSSTTVTTSQSTNSEP